VADPRPRVAAHVHIHRVLKDAAWRNLRANGSRVRTLNPPVVLERSQRHYTNNWVAALAWIYAYLGCRPIWSGCSQIGRSGTGRLGHSDGSV